MSNKKVPTMRAALISSSRPSLPGSKYQTSSQIKRIEYIRQIYNDNDDDDDDDEDT